jgi:hypothetical protein
MSPAARSLEPDRTEGIVWAARSGPAEIEPAALYGRAVRRRLASLALLALCALAGCGAASDDEPRPLPPPIGVGPGFRLPSLTRATAAGEPVAGLRCTRGDGPRVGVHLELFARREVLIVPPGVGVALPRVRDGAYVRPRGCSYALRTLEPTGVIELDPRARGARLGDFFALWGQPLGRSRMAGFRGPVSAFVGGRRWTGDPRAIPVRRHAQIVLEVGGYVRPHSRYLFPPGL